MKTHIVLPRSPKWGKIAILLACLAACGVAQAYKLGGSWVGTWVGTDSYGDPTRIEFTFVMVPDDPSGRSAQFAGGEWLAVGQDFEDLMAWQAIRASHSIGPIRMIDSDTLQYTMIWYGVTAEIPNVIRIIYVLSGQMDFIDADHLVDQSVMRIYLTNDAVIGPPATPPEADADHDLFPDAGAIPIIEMEFSGALARRVPLLEP